jgi:hypothetical protein
MADVAAKALDVKRRREEIEEDWGIEISLALTALTVMVTSMIQSQSMHFFLCSTIKALRSVCSGVVVAGLIATEVYGQSLASLRVVDCNGQTRALKSVTIEEVTEVQVQLNSLEVRDLKLVNSKGEVLHGEIEDGVATFSDVPADIWVLTSNDPAAFYTKISFQPSLPGFWVTAGEVALVAVGVVGVAAIAGAFGGGGGGGDSHGDGSGGGDVCATCNPDQDAPSIGPFSITR